MENAKQNDVAIKIDAALVMVERDNPLLKGALPSSDYLEINKIGTLKDPEYGLNIPACIGEP